MSEIKDKRIFIYEIVSKRDTQENEIKAKKYIHSKIGLWAYVREMSEREKFTAKSTGVENTTVFKVNYNALIKAGQHIDFKGETYIIQSIDGYEFYKRDLTVRAVRTNIGETVYEQYDEC